MALGDKMKNSIEMIKEDINNLNVRKKVKIRLRKKHTEKYSLYLDLWKNGKRSYEYLNKYVVGTKESVLADDEALRYAISYRDRLELDIDDDNSNLKHNKKYLNANFVEYLKAVAERKTGTTKKKWLSLYKHLYAFSNGLVAIKDIDAKFCRSFYDYLNKRGNYSTPKVYYKVFSAALNQLVYDEIITSNPATKAAKNPDIKFKLNQNKEKQREFLSMEEIKLLIGNPIKNKQIMNAFIFSCFTGLRLEDVENLTFNAINEGYIYFRQLKTRGDDRMKLHPKALEIIEEQKKLQGNSGFVFNLIDNKAVNKHIARWIKGADISKKISFHCARHSFATICVTNDVDIYSVQKLMGHKEISSTQIYAKLIDKKKDEAIDKIPVI